jgi:hypothetical protein
MGSERKTANICSNLKRWFYSCFNCCQCSAGDSVCLINSILVFSLIFYALLAYFIISNVSNNANLNNEINQEHRGHTLESLWLEGLPFASDSFKEEVMELDDAYINTEVKDIIARVADNSKQKKYEILSNSHATAMPVSYDSKARLNLRKRRFQANKSIN